MRTAIPSALVCICFGLFLLNLTQARPAAAENNNAAAAPEVPNQNTLITAHLEKLKFSCSTQWAGWPPERAFDSDPTTSWFTARGDAAAHGRTPWLEVEFPADVTIRRITLHANREPPWQVGYTIRVGRLQCFDAQNKVVYEKSGELGGKTETIEFRPPQPIPQIRRIRFTSLQDDGDKNPYDDIALGEMFVE
jgi:hypothetical protein